MPFLRTHSLPSTLLDSISQPLKLRKAKKRDELSEAKQYLIEKYAKCGITGKDIKEIVQAEKHDST